MPLGEQVKGRLRYGLDNPFTRNIDPTLVLDLPLSEGVGDLVHDRSLYGNHGTIYGASWVDGKIGKALSFDGVDDYGKIVNSTSLQEVTSGDELTVMVWVKTSDVGFQVFRDGSYLIDAYSATQTRWQLWPPPPTTYVPIFGGSITDDKWHHIVGTYKNPDMKLYIDSALVATGTMTGPLRGSENYGNPAHFLSAYSEAVVSRNILDEVRIYNRALNADEILRLYNEGK